MNKAHNTQAHERIRRAQATAAGEGRAAAFALLLREYDAAIEGVREESMRSRPLDEYFSGTADKAIVLARHEYENARAALKLFAYGAAK